jgi:hypothetical protein
MSAIFSGTYMNGIVLSGAIDNPSTMTAGSLVENSSTSAYGGDAVFGKSGTAWTLTNYGALLGTLSTISSTGIYLASGGLVTNAQSGYVEGAYNGVEVGGASGSVANLGTVSALSAYGVRLQSGGSVTNGATSDTGALISGNLDGILVIVGAGSVANFGTIRGQHVVGVDLPFGGGVTNGHSGSGAGLITGVNGGIVISSSPGTVTNYGTVTATGTATQGQFPAPAGVSLVEGGRLTNHGTISGYVGVYGGTLGRLDIANYGTILGTGTGGLLFPGPFTYAVYMRDGGSITNGRSDAASALIKGMIAIRGSGTVTNFGTVTSNHIGYAMAVSTGAIVNLGTVDSRINTGINLGSGILVNGEVGSTKALIGSKYDAVVIGAATVVNYGTIDGYDVGVRGAAGTVVDFGAILSSGFYGIELARGGIVTIGQYGYVSGGSIGILFNQQGTAGSGTVITAGTIASQGTAISFSVGGNLLVVDPGAVFIGTVDGSSTHAGGDTLELAAGATAGVLTGLGFQFIDFTELTVDPGAVWCAVGTNELLGGSMTNSGTLQVEGVFIVGGSATNFGEIDLEAGSALQLRRGASSSGTIAFDGAGAQLKIGQPGTAAGVANRITGFASGDKIDLAGVVANSDTYSGGILTLANNGTLVAELTVSTPYATPYFRLGADSFGGTTIGVEPVYGDLNGDGTSDLVFQNGTTGNLWLWDMNGSQVVGSGPLPTPSSGWNVAAAADFFGNGHPDLLFQNQGSGNLWIWQMNGSAIVGSSGLPSPAAGLKVVGVDDFYGDGHSDILFQNQSTGALSLWEMSGTSIIATANLPAPSAGWIVVGTGDLFGDDHADILFQNQGSNALWVWEMHGTQITKSAGLPTPSSGWGVVGVGELAGGGQADMVFQNQNSGALWEWAMSGTTITASQGLTTPAADWHVRAV